MSGVLRDTDFDFDYFFNITVCYANRSEFVCFFNPLSLSLSLSLWIINLKDLAYDKHYSVEIVTNVLREHTIFLLS